MLGYNKIYLLGLFSFCCATIGRTVWAEDNISITMDWGTMSMQLLGGLALFLFGMEQMADAPMRLANYKVELEMMDKLKRIFYYSKPMARINVISIDHR